MIFNIAFVLICILAVLLIIASCWITKVEKEQNDADDKTDHVA